MWDDHRKVIGSHDDHDNFDGQPYSSLAPHTNNTPFKASLNQGGVNCTKIWCLVQPKHKFSPLNDSTWMSYYDSPQHFKQCCCQLPCQWQQLIPATKQMPHHRTWSYPLTRVEWLQQEIQWILYWICYLLQWIPSPKHLQSCKQCQWLLCLQHQWQWWLTSTWLWLAPVS